MSHYRPISITPTPVKVMEKIIRSKLLSWVENLQLIPLEQHGFLAGLSITTNVVDTLFDWELALNQGMSVDVVYLDFSKAFDKVSHAKLIDRLKALGINGHLLDWFISYLSNRHMTVRVGNEFSQRLCCTSGVPQGGVLSSLLFLLYTMDLPKLFSTSQFVKTKIFADDIKIYGIYNEDNSYEVCSELERSIAKLYDYVSSWNLTMNIDKCFVMHIGKGAARDYSISGDHVF